MNIFKKFRLLFLAIIICSYNTNATSNSTEKSILKENQQVSEVFIERQNEKQFTDTIRINYNENKTILNILKAVPETTMSSWEWSEMDRKKTVDFIEKNNYLIDSTEAYNNIKYIKPNTIGIQVVDGFWTLSIYEFGVNHYFIVTNDSVGDGNDIQTFNYINNKLTPTKMINWFSKCEYDLLLKNSDNCIELVKENELTYTYDFSNKDIVEISSWFLTKDKSQHCFKGNTIKYKLNKDTKTFDIFDVYWENK